VQDLNKEDEQAAQRSDGYERASHKPPLGKVGSLRRPTVSAIRNGC
jgi:hypothetical protein